MFVLTFFYYILTSIDFYPIWYEYKKVIIFLMSYSTYLYSFFILFGICSLVYFLFIFRTGKNQINNKIVLKNLLESLDMDLPDELKGLDSSSTDPQKFS